MGNGPSKESSKKHSSSKHGASSEHKRKSKCCKGSTCKNSEQDPATLRAVFALRHDFLKKLPSPEFMLESHPAWRTLTKDEQGKAQQLKANFQDTTDEQLQAFVDDWQRDFPEDMDYGYNVEEDTLYPQEARSPENILYIFQEERSKLNSKEPERGRTRERQPDIDHETLKNLHSRPNTPPMPGMVPEDYAELREELRNAGADPDATPKASASRPSGDGHSSSKHSSSKEHSSSKHSSSRHSSSKHSSSKENSSSKEHSSSKHSSSRHSSSKHGSSSSSRPSGSKSSSSKEKSSSHGHKSSHGHSSSSHGHKSSSHGHKSSSHGHKSSSHGHKSSSHGHKSSSHGHKSSSHGHKSSSSRH
ncbi:hypothetical protein T069G_01929 [Trichoderma breve]|uniref:Uncharacterized protein n=1 Tax=Trichoderma breve TaxID=2034170 RepID=A0A9W9EEX1_9HYPO|nr:hypothetical protein T069G_01929 [Trichoderma breve]KAJ4865399.1 hypothetical protein T069G_01929 [Trichoderma breve]